MRKIKRRIARYKMEKCGVQHINRKTTNPQTKSEQVIFLNIGANIFKIKLLCPAFRERGKAAKQG